MIDTVELRKAHEEGWLSDRTISELLDEIDTLRAQLAEYAPIREYYGPAGFKAVSESIRERDEARKCVTLLKEMMVGHCWCETAKRTGYIKCNVCTTLSRVNEIERGEG